VARRVEALGFELRSGCKNLTSTNLKFPELVQHDLAYKMKSWMYLCCKLSIKSGNENVKMLVLDIQNVVDHWAGLHNACATQDQNRKCVKENRSYSQRYYELGGEIHKAIKL
jgi:hypothetical protein